VKLTTVVIAASGLLLLSAGPGPGRGPAAAPVPAGSGRARVSGARASAPDFSDAVAAGRRILDTLRVEATIPGLSVAVYAGDRIVWSEAFGRASLELDAPVTPESMFRIASVSKELTGTAVAKLVEDGKLDLDAPISTYVSGLPEAWHGITVRELASHTSGIGHYTSPEDALDTHDYATTAEALTRFEDRPLLFPPGTSEAYSSYAYTVIAAVIEGVTGTDYLTHMRRAIFEPLGMAHTRADEHDAIIPGRTAFYDYDSTGAVVNAPFDDLSARWAGSGFLSTAGDLARFGAAHLAPGFLKRQTLNLMMSPQRIRGDGTTHDGLGWGRRTGWEGDTLYWGNGKTPGSTCGLLVRPGHGVAVALLANVKDAPIERGDLQALSLRFVGDLDGDPAGPPPADLQGRHVFEATLRGKSFQATIELDTTGAAPRGSVALPFPGLERSPVVDAFRWHGAVWILAVNRETGVVPVRLTPAGGGYAGEILRYGIALRGPAGG